MNRLIAILTLSTLVVTVRAADPVPNTLSFRNIKVRELPRPEKK